MLNLLLKCYRFLLHCYHTVLSANISTFLTRVYLHLSVDQTKGTLNLNHDQLNLVFSISFWLHCFTHDEELYLNLLQKPLTATVSTFRWTSQYVYRINCSTSNTFTRASILATVSNILQLQWTFISQGFYDPQQTAELWMRSQPKQARVNSQAANDIMISWKRYSQPGGCFMITPTKQCINGAEILNIKLLTSL